MWPPIIGKPLPRAEDAWIEPRKWQWILGDQGHGDEWRRVFRVDARGALLAWTAIEEALPTAPVVSLRITSFGHGCGVLLDLTLGDRHSRVLTAWHYAYESAAPRLVTAHPTTYTRSNGNLA
jgi:hypothetical protein